ncbi:hypothetical protein KAH37_10620 [bacterium]|nr:hypothetical protein [bacterium]
MRLLKAFTAVLFILLIFLTVNAAPKLIVLPVAAKKGSAQQFAKALDKELSYQSSDMKGVKALSYRKAIKNKNYRIKLKKCAADLGCQKKIAKKSSRGDFYLFTKLKLGKGRRAFVTIYLFDGAFNKLDSQKIKGSPDTDESDLAEKIIARTNTLLENHLDQDEDFGDEEDEPEVSDEPDAEELITTGLQAYKNGEYKESIKSLAKAAKKDVVAKKLLKLTKSAISYFKQAKKASNGGQYDKAMGYISRFEKKDGAIRKIGKNYRVFAGDKSEHAIYISPTKKDVSIVRKIYKKYAKKIEGERKKKIDATSAADRWLNDSIVARIKEIERLTKEGQTQNKKGKTEYAALQKHIKDLKYQWEKDDSVLEQKLVKLESKLTMMEQKEKGVIKISTKKIDDAQKAEKIANEKKFKERMTLLKKEKDTFYDKQKGSFDTMSKGVDVKVTSFTKKQTTNKASIKKLEEKIAKMRDTFEAKERKVTNANEAKKMSFEDSDRKYQVTVEKEYQKKFDELNKKLQEYDSKESAEKKKLGIYNTEKEDHLIKNADEMGKIQEEIEKKRTVIDKKYKTDKAEAQTKAEKEYADKLTKAKSDKESLDKEIADKNEKSEAFIAGEEEALKAAGKKPAQIKAAIRKLKQANKKETAALTKKLKKATKELSQLESGKDEFIMQNVAQIDMAYEKDSMELDMKLANENNRLQKDNKKFSKQSNLSKKKADKKFKQFMDNKTRFKKNIDKQIALAQKNRDKKSEKRKKERENQVKKWEKEKTLRQSSFDRKISPDKKKIERLRKENEQIEVKIANTSHKLSNKQEDMKVKHQENGEKFDTAWQAKVELAKKNHREAKEAIENKYAEKEVSKKQLFKKQKEELNDEVETLNGEKNIRKEKRKKTLLEEKNKWIEKKKAWKTQSIDRLAQIKNLKKEKKIADKADRKESAKRKKASEKQYQATIKQINKKMLAQVQKKYKNTTKIVSKRDIEPAALTTKANSLKANIQAKLGLTKLQKKKLLAAMEAFKAALYLDRDNATALNGIKAVESTAKTLFWEAYGMRDSNKPKAVSIFKLLIKTLTPSNEMFVRSITELESLK